MKCCKYIWKAPLLVPFISLLLRGHHQAASDWVDSLLYIFLNGSSQKEGGEWSKMRPWIRSVLSSNSAPAPLTSWVVYSKLLNLSVPPLPLSSLKMGQITLHWVLWGWDKTIHVKQWFTIKDQFAPQGTFGSVRKHTWWSRLGCAIGI